MQLNLYDSNSDVEASARLLPQCYSNSFVIVESPSYKAYGLMDKGKLRHSKRSNQLTNSICCVHCDRDVCVYDIAVSASLDSRLPQTTNFWRFYSCGLEGSFKLAGSTHHLPKVLQFNGKSQEPGQHWRIQQAIFKSSRTVVHSFAFSIAMLHCMLQLGQQQSAKKNKIMRGL